jgi:hypothetical protein
LNRQLGDRLSTNTEIAARDEITRGVPAVAVAATNGLLLS